MVKEHKPALGWVRSLIAVLMAVLVFSGATAHAATNLPDGFIIGDSDGIHVEADGAYMIDVDHLTPGEVITKTLTIRNLERGKTPFSLSMTAEPGQVSGPANLLDIITLTLTLDGKTLYSGRLRGDEGADMVRNALPLGIYKEGDTTILQIRLEVGDFDLAAGKSTADIGWQFYAVKEDNQPPPITGDYIRYGLYIFASLASLTMLALLVFTKRRKEQDAPQERTP